MVGPSGTFAATDAQDHAPYADQVDRALILTAFSGEFNKFGWVRVLGAPAMSEVSFVKGFC